MAYDVFSEFYDSLTDNVEYEKRAEYFCRLLSAYGQKNGILLDLACGTGSMAVLMAQKGYDVIGVDYAVGMLNAAREKAMEAGQNILLLCQPMEELDLFGTVDCCISVLDSINHLPDAHAVKSAFAGVSLFMNPGGVFLFDVNTIYKHREVLGSNAFVYENEDLFCAWQNTFHPEDNSVDITLDFFSEQEDGAWLRSYEEFSEQAYPLEDIARWLEESGFDVKGIYEDMTTDPVTPETQRAVFAAVKRK